MMKKLILTNVLLFLSLDSFAGHSCEKLGGFKNDDIGIPAEFKSEHKANAYQTTYLICRTLKPIPAGHTIQFNINHGEYIQTLDHDYFTLRTPELRLLNNGAWDYFTVAINLQPGWPSTYTYECEYYLCKG